MFVAVVCSANGVGGRCSALFGEQLISGGR